MDGDVGLDRQVQAVAGGAEEGQRCAHAHAVGVVHGDGADSARIGVVHVRVVGEAGVAGGVIERLLGWQPGRLGEAADGDEAFRVVKVVGPEVHVAFQLPQVGQDAGEAPLVVAQGGPGVVVLGHAAQQHLAVDGAGAADYPAARHRHRLGRQGSCVALEGPVVRGVNGRGRLVVAELEVVGVGLEIWVVRPGLQKQHRLAGVFRQPAGQSAAGGTCAEDDVVVFHACLLTAHGPLRGKGAGRASAGDILARSWGGRYGGLLGGVTG